MSFYFTSLLTFYQENHTAFTSKICFIRFFAYNLRCICICIPHFFDRSNVYPCYNVFPHLEKKSYLQYLYRLYRYTLYSALAGTNGTIQPTTNKSTSLYYIFHIREHLHCWKKWIRRRLDLLEVFKNVLQFRALYVKQNIFKFVRYSKREKLPEVPVLELPEWH